MGVSQPRSGPWTHRRTLDLRALPRPGRHRRGGRRRGDHAAPADRHLRRHGARGPVEALLAGCAAYVGFGVREPARYRILFGWARPKPEAPAADVPGRQGLDAFQILVDNLDACVRAGRSSSTDPFADAVTIWAALHGQVTLRADPGFPWPPADTVEQMARRLGRIDP
ncbi:TetR-like C-terminal domain-containing protein [Kitasatospora sp. NPDC052868]|uniref:TetR-like C-terminal domain-containing protein n=1 Tax=Kitasatospora sp. NPDC052868 TaxID=3364060 RepID=UPI0037C6E8D4